LPRKIHFVSLEKVFVQRRNVKQTVSALFNDIERILSCDMKEIIHFLLAYGMGSLYLRSAKYMTSNFHAIACRYLQMGHIIRIYYLKLPQE
jgi:hypothetical protein